MVAYFVSFRTTLSVLVCLGFEQSPFVDDDFSIILGENDEFANLTSSSILCYGFF